ncbi:MAG: hypothetical protein JWL91_2532 [Sphingomonas bacterium]|nr:hypothetical protein [Sphingomonas bacterium]MDB5690656.1 hypothetical protein [Sphingomonas bacterium]
MRRPPLLLVAMLAGATPAAGTPPLPSLRCTIAQALNGSTGEPTGMEGRSSLIAAGELTLDGGDFTASTTTHDAHGSEVVSYRIRRAGLAFEATALRKRDDIGEEHLIRLSGRCTRFTP